MKNALCTSSSVTNELRDCQSAAQAYRGPGHRQRRKVLVVDDERDLADLAEALLTVHGFDVSVAYGAADALRILEDDQAIDAVFSDVMMPRMTGLELAGVVESLYPRVRIVLTSGYMSPALIAEHDQRYPFATKPYRIDTVVELLRG